jgi:hypothetical protein
MRLTSFNFLRKLFSVFRIRIRRIRVFLDLLEPDPLFICTDPDPSINKQKNGEKP